MAPLSSNTPTHREDDMIQAIDAEQRQTGRTTQTSTQQTVPTQMETLLRLFNQTMQVK